MLLVDLSRFELRQYFSDKAGMFWTFLFPVVLMMLLNAMYSNMHKLNGKQLPYNIHHCEESQYIQKFIALTEQHFPGEFNFTHSRDIVAEKGRIYLNLHSMCFVFFDSPIDQQSSIYADGVDQDASDSIKQKLSLINLKYRSAFQLMHAKNELNLQGTISNNKDTDKYIAEYVSSGVISSTLFSLCMFTIALWIVQMRNSNVFKRYRLFPIRPTYIIAAFMMSRAVIMLLYILVFIPLAVFMYSVDIHYENVFLMAVLVMLGIACFISIGILFSSTFNSYTAAMGFINIAYFTVTFFGNLYIPNAYFPLIVQQLISLTPPSAFVEAFRVLAFDHDKSLPVLIYFLALLFWCVLAFAISAKSFKWEARSK